MSTVSDAQVFETRSTPRPDDLYPAMIDDAAIDEAAIDDAAIGGSQPAMTAQPAVAPSPAPRPVPAPRAAAVSAPVSPPSAVFTPSAVSTPSGVFAPSPAPARVEYRAAGPEAGPGDEKPPARWLRPVQVVGISAAWVAVVTLAAAVPPMAGGLRQLALLAHLVFLAISFGAVLAVELNGLAMLLRLAKVGRVVNVALALDPMIWIGLVGLSLSGILLAPQLSSPWTWIKLVAVLAVAVNGLWARDLLKEYRALPAESGLRAVPAALLRRSLRLSAVSQTGWWVAVLIGFLSTNG